MLRSKVACAVRTPSSMDFTSRFGRGRIGQSSVDGGFLRHHIRVRLHGFQLRDHLALLDVIAFFDQDLGDRRRAEGIGAQIDVILGL